MAEFVRYSGLSGDVPRIMEVPLGLEPQQGKERRRGLLLCRLPCC